MRIIVMKNAKLSCHDSVLNIDPGARNPVCGQEWTTSGRITCRMETDFSSISDVKPAVTFLKKHGDNTLVSLGCGSQVNRIDNHLRLMVELNLTYYVGIDCAPGIEPAPENLFMAPDDATMRLSGHYNGRSQNFWDAMRLFPGTYVEELAGIHCAAIVCQRVYPNYNWEDSIFSMTPLLVLQEDLHGCERQKLRGEQYVRNWSRIRTLGLQPFRPWPLFPGEKNMVLWRRRDFVEKKDSAGRFGWLERLAERFIG